MDDAVWVSRTNDGGFLLTTSITDLTGSITKGSALDRKAFELEAMIAKGVGKGRLLGDSVTNYRFSLRPKEKRDTIAIRIEFDRTGAMLKVKSYMASLESLGAFANDEFDHLWNQNDGSEIGNMVRDAAELGKLLWMKSIRRKTTSSHVSAFTDDGEIKTNARPGDIGQAIIGELMQATNKAATRIVLDCGHPMIFRNTTQMTSLFRTELSTQCTGHVGLERIPYGTFTSPMRRYVDMINQRVLVAATRRHGAPYTERELSYIAEHINQRSSVWFKGSFVNMLKGEGASDIIAEVQKIVAMESYEFNDYIKKVDFFSDADTIAIWERLEKSCMSYAGMATIMFKPENGGRKNLQEYLMLRLAATPGAAEKLLRVASRWLNKKSLVLVMEKKSDTWNTVATLGGVSAESSGTEYSATRHEACLSLIGKLISLRRPDTRNQKDDRLNLIDDESGPLLLELCNIMNWGDPEFVGPVKKNGWYVAQVKVENENGIYVSDKYRSRCLAGAIEGAAKIALDELSTYAAEITQKKRDGDVDWLGLINDEFNRGPTIALKKFSYTYDFELKTRWIVENPFAKEFECKMWMTSDVGRVVMHGTGRTRRAAETAACRAIINATAKSIVPREAYTGNPNPLMGGNMMASESEGAVAMMSPGAF